MTARLATHADVANRTAEVLERLVQAGVDVDPVDTRASSPDDDGDPAGPLAELRDATIDLALVGLGALKGSVAEDLTTVAVFPREEVRDVLVTLTGDPTPLTELPAGDRIGVVGARRSAFLAAHRPDLEGVHLSGPEMAGLLRGTVDPADAGVTAIVVSALEARLEGLVDTTVEALDAKAWLPEPGQGVLALVARHPIAEATALDHLPTRTALRTELALVDALGPNAGAALGCLAQPSGRWIRLWAAVASADGRRLVRSDRTGPLDEAEALGSQVARELEARGVELVTAGGAG